MGFHAVLSRFQIHQYSVYDDDGVIYTSIPIASTNAVQALRVAWFLLPFAGIGTGTEYGDNQG